METTLFPLATLPACASLCGHLYDANGACVPPAVATAAESVYASCFCANAQLQPFSTGSTGVCDDACTADPGGLASIQGWYTSFCAANAAVATTTNAATTTTSGTGTSSATATSTGSSSSGSKVTNDNGGTWISNHWQWVIFIVVVVVGIAVIWIGACIWRRRYLRKRDRQYALSKSLAKRTSSGGSNLAVGSQSQHSVHMPQAGFFEPANLSSANIYDTTEKGRNTLKSGRLR